MREIIQMREQAGRANVTSSRTRPRALARGILGILVLAHMTCAAARAEGLLFSLPPDGTAARYSMEIAGKTGGGDVKGSGEISLASVGTLPVGDDKCRWIEVKLALKINDNEERWLGKFLVPETHLGKGKSLAKNVKRGWLKVQDEEPMAVSDIPGISQGPLAIFVVGPGADAHDLEKAEVQNAVLGKLLCAGHRARHELDQGTESISITYESRLHEKSPFGVVESNMTFEVKNAGQTVITGTALLKLIDVNTTALSELADRN